MDNITKAREIFQPHEATTGSSGWSRHVEEIAKVISQLKSHYEDKDKVIFARWRAESRVVMSEQQHNKWHLLIQYGVQELLYFLHGCLADLIHKGEEEKAVDVLVRSMSSDDNRQSWLSICFNLRNTGPLKE